MIASGNVTVNGRPAQRNDRITGRDEVSVNGKLVRGPKHIYIILNKPRGYLTAVRDERAKTVFDLLPAQLKGLFPVGRLDRDTSGLLLLSNDGQWAHQILHPSKRVSKRYRVVLDRDFEMDKIRAGIQLPDGFSKFDHVKPLATRSLEVALHQGRKRQIRRTFVALGYRVIELVRTGIGGINLGTLAEGEYRQLEKDEIQKASAGAAAP